MSTGQSTFLPNMNSSYINDHMPTSTKKSVSPFVPKDSQMNKKNTKNIFSNKLNLKKIDLNKSAITESLNKSAITEHNLNKSVITDNLNTTTIKKNKCPMNHTKNLHEDKSKNKTNRRVSVGINLGKILKINN